MSDQLFREPREDERWALPSDIVQRWTIPVEPCEHGKIDEHMTEYHPLKDRKLDGHWCEGAALKGTDE